MGMCVVSCPVVWVGPALISLLRSWAVATCLFWASVLSITFPRILSAFTAVGGKAHFTGEIGTLIAYMLPAFGFYAGLNVVALVMIFFLLPGTLLPLILVVIANFDRLMFRNETTNPGG